MTEYVNYRGEQFTVDEVDSVPRLLHGKWDFLHGLVRSLKYGDKPLRIRLNSINDVYSARVTISRITKEGGLPSGYIVKTVSQPVDRTKKDGEYFLFMYLFHLDES